MTSKPTEIEGAPRIEDAARRIYSGEVLVLRGCLQALGLMEEMRDASLEGVRRHGGSGMADRVAAEGFDAIHRVVDASDIPGISSHVCDVVGERGPAWIRKVVEDVLGWERTFYFEQVPNVRFLIPYDLAVAEREAFRKYAVDHGDGKVTPHGPHRDSWLDCPTNALNVWIAVGPVVSGNGMTVFPERYEGDLPFTPRGDLSPEVGPGTPESFDLAPGDAIVFHGDQLHASEINQTDVTRHVVSFRLTLGRPQYRAGQYHHYVHSGLHHGPLRPLASLPANLTWRWVQTRLGWVARDVKALLGGGAKAGTNGTASRPAEAPSEFRVDASSLPPGSLQPLSDRVCAARLEDGRVVAFSRRCPHEGADLALGRVDGERVVCPWHNLSIDPQTGRSPCDSLKPLRVYPVQVEGERIQVSAQAVPRDEVGQSPPAAAPLD